MRDDGDGIFSRDNSNDTYCGCRYNNNNMAAIPCYLNCRIS